MDFSHTVLFWGKCRRNMEPRNCFFCFFVFSLAQITSPVVFKSNRNHHIYTIYTLWIRRYCLLISSKGTQVVLSLTCHYAFSVCCTFGRWKSSTQRHSFFCGETMNVDIWRSISPSNKNVSKSWPSLPLFSLCLSHLCYVALSSSTSPPSTSADWIRSCTSSLSVVRAAEMISFN